MKVLAIGGTRYFGKGLVQRLLAEGHEITIATRGLAALDFKDQVKHLKIDRCDAISLKEQLGHQVFDVVYDMIAYSSNDIKKLMSSGIRFDRYILMSTTAVYHKHLDTVEDEFHPDNKELIWCDRNAYSYAEVKKQSEIALFKHYYNHQNVVAVRYPFVIGKNDYTNRLKFYIQNILEKKEMYIDNVNHKMSFIHEEDASGLLAHLCRHSFRGAINGASMGTISICDIITYVESKTGIMALYGEKGLVAPYNGENEYSISVRRAESIGYKFSDLNTWIYELIDYYIEELKA